MKTEKTVYRPSGCYHERAASGPTGHASDIGETEQDVDPDKEMSYKDFYAFRGDTASRRHTASDTENGKSDGHPVRGLWAVCYL